MRNIFFCMAFFLMACNGGNSEYVPADPDPSDDLDITVWTSRLGVLNYSLRDVTWDGTVFVAVGDGGAVLTSADGIDWVERESGTADDLLAIAAYGSELIAVGEEIVLMSTDHGASWIIRGSVSGVRLSAVATDSSQAVVGGYILDTGAPVVMVSDDRAESWQLIDSSPAVGHAFADLVYHDGLFVAVADSFFSIGGGWIYVSADGAVWNEIFRSTAGGLAVVVHAGDRFVAAGPGGAVFSSFDGFNWTEMGTPVEGVDYLSAAWDGSTLAVAGGYSCSDLGQCSPPEPEVPVGLASTDGGTSWDVFTIDGEYQSLGLAFGNGRFVSVGRMTPTSAGGGAIYTAD